MRWRTSTMRTCGRRCSTNGRCGGSPRRCCAIPPTPTTPCSTRWRRRQPAAAALRRHALNLRKLAARRHGRERAAARGEAVPAADELLQRDQLRRRVADAVLALDEPYRTTVWLRWFEDLSAADVAQRMQAPL